MAIELRAHLVDPEDGRIYVTHSFWGRGHDNEDALAEARQNMEAHAKSCEKFGPALERGDVIEEVLGIAEYEVPDPEDFEEDDENDPN